MTKSPYFEKNLKEEEAAHGRAPRRVRPALGLRVADVTARRHLLHGGGLLRVQPGSGGLGTSQVSIPRQLQQYGAALEEAYPFEEKAIAVHQKNLELLATGVYNPWIEKSLGKLAILMPGTLREVRGEQRLDRVGRRYAYEAPKVTATAPSHAERACGRAAKLRPAAAPDTSSEAADEPKGAERCTAP